MFYAFQIKKDYLVSEFKWLLFTNRSNLQPEKDREMLTPFNCEFIFAYQEDETNYKLIEKYKVTNTTFTHDYGIWENGYGWRSITNTFFYWRRLNLNGTTLIMNYIKKTPVWKLIILIRCSGGGTKAPILLSSEC